MADEKPGVYLFYGEDELLIAQAIADLEARLGDPTTVALNKTVIDGRSFDLDELRRTASAMPFLAQRRVVIVRNGVQRLTTPALQEKFCKLLLELPNSTAVILVEQTDLKNEHWLVRWAQTQKGRVFARKYHIDHEKQLPDWIKAQVKRAGGRITDAGAGMLAAMVGSDTVYLHQEIQKLLVYVNYSRPIDEQDVNQITVGPLQSNVFAMVDALGDRKGKQALGELERLFEMEDPIQIFGMIVRQYRLLILIADVLKQGGGMDEVERRTGIKGFIVRKLLPQARQFSLEQLEDVYRRLLNLDWEIKTGVQENQVGMDMFVADITTRSE